MTKRLSHIISNIVKKMTFGHSNCKGNVPRAEGASRAEIAQVVVFVNSL